MILECFKCFGYFIEVVENFRHASHEVLHFFACLIYSTSTRTDMSARHQPELYNIFIRYDLASAA